MQAMSAFVAQNVGAKEMSRAGKALGFGIFPRRHDGLLVYFRRQSKLQLEVP